MRTHDTLFSSADEIFSFIFLLKILIQNWLKFISMNPINSRSELVQKMVWCPTGDKPLSEAMLTLFTDAYTIHLTSDDLILTETLRKKIKYDLN